MYKLTIRSEYPAHLVGFYHDNRTPTKALSFAKFIPCSCDELYAWGTPDDARNVQYDQSGGMATYRFETSMEPTEWFQQIRHCYRHLGMSLEETKH